MANRGAKAGISIRVQPCNPTANLRAEVLGEGLYRYQRDVRRSLAGERQNGSSTR